MQNVFDIGGRRLFLESGGSGVPTVILEAGGGCFSATWDSIWDDLTHLTHTCRYDRASLGRSDRLVRLDPSHHDSWSRERAILPPETAQDSATLSELRQSLSRSAAPADGEDIDSEACQNEARATGSLGDLPLAVVTGTRRRSFPDVPADVTDRRYQLKYDLHRELAALSSRGRLIPAVQSGHMVHLDEPAVVIGAIRSIFNVIRADQAAQE